MRKIAFALAVFIAMVGCTMATEATTTTTSTVKYDIAASLSITSGASISLDSAGAATDTLTVTNNVNYDLYGKDDNGHSAGNLYNPVGSGHTLAGALNVASSTTGAIFGPTALSYAASTSNGAVLKGNIPVGTDSIVLAYTQSLTDANYAGTYSTTVTYTIQATV
jgi:hypothetical protein